ncbi:MAG: hypothetical protein ACMXYA_00600 [Candidatus Woesearchaeota archaeon]
MKTAQVSLYILVGILMLLFIIVIGIIISPEPNDQITDFIDPSQSLARMQSFIATCLETTTENMVPDLTQQTGIFNRTLPTITLFEQEIGLFFHQGQVLYFPTNRFFETEMQSYVQYHMNLCTENLQTNDINAELTTQEPIITVNIHLETIEIYYDLNFMIQTGDLLFESYPVRRVISKPYGQMLEMVEIILGLQEEHEFIPLGEIIQFVESHDMSFHQVYAQNDTYIFGLTSYRPEEFTFSYASSYGGAFE